MSLLNPKITAQFQSVLTRVPNEAQNILVVGQMKT